MERAHNMLRACVVLLEEADRVIARHKTRLNRIVQGMNSVPGWVGARDAFLCYQRVMTQLEEAHVNKTSLWEAFVALRNWFRERNVNMSAVAVHYWALPDVLPDPVDPATMSAWEAAIAQCRARVARLELALGLPERAALNAGDLDEADRVTEQRIGCRRLILDIIRWLAG